MLRTCRPHLASGSAQTARYSTVHRTVSSALAPSRVRNPGLERSRSLPLEQRRSGRDSPHVLRTCRPHLASGSAQTARYSTVHRTVSSALAPSRVRNPGLERSRSLPLEQRRSGRDSNPRDGVLPPTRFPVVLLKPSRTPLRNAGRPPQAGAIIAHGDRAGFARLPARHGASSGPVWPAPSVSRPVYSRRPAVRPDHRFMAMWAVPRR